ncbi:bifunctional 4-hydroxy-2-oxoglutarate aldolase/2-dehydro-3-deoxy-phosphogluconate aldolase [Luteolibacter algae]|uniref:2-dehydro-3-deoxy-phosphogluconate aldolase n=1 Tax=Luteolibacter algae TaxID=454151 RepID=A0ABW5DA07_9BACT
MLFPTNLIDRMKNTGIVAGFSIDKIEHAVPLAEALLAGGIDVIELTLRTPQGIEAVRAISSEVNGMLVGVGTILTPGQVTAVKSAGGHFGVSPGCNPAVIRAASETGLPFAPGIATPSELETAIGLGCRFVKFFPAEALGGVSYLRSMKAPYQHLGIEYFPLGGLNAGNMMEYLKEDDVPAIGGSWIVKNDLVLDENWEAITLRAKAVREALK